MNALTILGSGAAEGIPASFCDCRICREARKSGGRDIRMRTAYSLNERVQIDMGPDFFSQENEIRRQLCPAETCFYYP